MKMNEDSPSSSNEDMEIPQPQRFLESRTAKDRRYHELFLPHCQADLPEFRADKCDDEDMDVLTISFPEAKPGMELDVERMKQELQHLPLEKILQFYHFFECDVEKTIKMCSNLVIPDLIPQYIKEYIIANIAMEREEKKAELIAEVKRLEKLNGRISTLENKTASSPEAQEALEERYESLQLEKKNNIGRKSMYFIEMFKNVVDHKDLVEFYYKEKNKIGNNNWRLDRAEKEPTEEQKLTLEEKMKKCGISIIDGTTKKKGAKKVAPRKTKKEASPDENAKRVQVIKTQIEKQQQQQGRERKKKKFFEIYN